MISSNGDDYNAGISAPKPKPDASAIEAVTILGEPGAIFRTNLKLGIRSESTLVTNAVALLEFRCEL